jgi:hypothetical protein
MPTSGARSPVFSVFVFSDNFREIIRIYDLQLVCVFLSRNLGDWGCIGFCGITVSIARI